MLQNALGSAAMFLISVFCAASFVFFIFFEAEVPGCRGKLHRHGLLRTDAVSDQFAAG